MKYPINLISIFLKSACVIASVLLSASVFAGWSVNGTQVIDPTGKEFIFRGVNHAHNWYPDKTPQALTDIAATGANAVRVVLSNGTQWVRNNGTDVANVIAQCKAAKLVCVLEVHDSTGFGESSAATNISNAAKYWISSDIKNAVIGQEDYVIINIANEPYGNGVNAATYTTETSAAIKAIRNAGLTHLLMVDAPNWGQDWSHIMRDNAAKVFAADSLSNTLFSVHMYESYNSVATVQDYLTSFKTQGFALVVGEFGSENNGKPVDVASILKYTQQLGIGYLAWSWGGNGDCCAALNITNNWNATNLSVWGNQLINGTNGISASSKMANIFPSANVSILPPVKAAAVGNILLVPTQADVATIFNRLYANVADDKFNENDVIKWHTELKSNANGKWKGLDYTSTIDRPKAFAPLDHLGRTTKMILAYINSKSSLYHQKELLIQIKSALRVNLEYQYPSVYPRNTWYEVYISAPSEYARSLILLRGQIPQPEFTVFSQHLLNSIGVKNFLDTKSQNLVWIANNTVAKGAIESNSGLVSQGFTAIASTLDFETRFKFPGVHMDYAWHEHEAQLYSGGYGLWYTGDIINNIKLAENTAYAALFTPAKIKFFSDTILNGHQWIGYKETMDFGSVGRDITRINGTKGINIKVLDAMKTLDPGNAQAYQNWKENRNGGPSAVSGNRNFWKTDFMVHRGAQYHLSVKVPSVRSNGTEKTNGENLQGFYLPLGATNINTNGNEYTDVQGTKYRAVYPVWDWSRIPGVTAELGVAYPPVPGEKGNFQANNNFGGGVSSGTAGVMAFDATYQSIASHKAYFFMGDAMYCMGTGIAANKPKAIVTSVNQSFLAGPISINTGTTNTGTTQTYTKGQPAYTNLAWVHHDTVGYVFPKTQKVVVQDSQQTGKWSAIGTAKKVGEAGDDVSENIFSLWIDHGIKPANGNYEYIVVPNKNLADFSAYAKNHGFIAVRNDAFIQAVRNGSRFYGAVFYKAGSVDMGDGLIVTANKEALVLIEKTPDGYKINVNDPLVVNSAIDITLNKFLKGANANTDTSISYDQTKKISTIHFALPSGVTAGSGVEKQVTVMSVGGSSSSKSSVSSSASSVIIASSRSKVSSLNSSVRSSTVSSIASSTRSSVSYSSSSVVPSSVAKSSLAKSSVSSTAISSSSRSSSISVSSLRCVYESPNFWNTGFVGVIRITNMGKNTVTGWTATWAYKGSSRITSSWNGILTGTNPYSAFVSATPNAEFSWNSSITPGQTIEFGFQGTTRDSIAETPLVNCQ